MTAHRFKTGKENTGCTTLHDETWTDDELLTPEGRQGLNCSVFHRAREAQLDKFRARFPNYNPPTERDSFGGLVKKAKHL